MLHFFWRRLQRDQRGFTLIELLIVIAIIAILAAILIPNFLRARRQSLVAATKGNLKNIGTALESYFVDRNSYPAGDDATGLGFLVSGGYIRSLPDRPGQPGVGYEYTPTGTPPDDYTVCDDTTDTITNAPDVTMWYYQPGGGLASEVGASCP